MNLNCKICIKWFNLVWICVKWFNLVRIVAKYVSESFNFAWIWATNFDWQLQILFNRLFQICFQNHPHFLFFALLFEEESCFRFHSFSFHFKFLWLVVVVMLKVVKIVSYPCLSIDHVHGKIKKSTKLLQAGRRFTNKQLFAIFDVQQISGSTLYSVKGDWHFEVNYKSQSVVVVCQQKCTLEIYQD